jgi:Family of unknown function (DUF5522)
MREPIADRPLDQPHQDRLSPAHPAYREILDAHSAARRNGSASYVDPFTGLMVMTAAFLEARGTCCQSGCRHCPYLP